ncbi:protein YecE [Enterobacter asburiae]|uniref:Protein YecE n=1 Tax=Enterobacter asburiae TaxID=61645 RepID=A0A376FC04_ENTAS|nr:protein YecE [Enterobacter asburiae]
MRSPKAEIVTRWREQTTDDFRFCFKFPATISHQAPHCATAGDLTEEFFTRMSPLANRIGQYWIQLPATFGPRDLPALWQFLDALPREFTYGVEVRHPEFFAKAKQKKRSIAACVERSVNRVILDSRPVHSAVPHSEAIVEAQRKKPKVPVHAIRDRAEPNGQVYRQR